MCGIAGLVATERASDLALRARAMADAIAHRGPDAEGYWKDDNVNLGHRRLSIIDLSVSPFTVNGFTVTLTESFAIQPLGVETERVKVLSDIISAVGCASFALSKPSLGSHE